MLDKNFLVIKVGRTREAKIDGDDAAYLSRFNWSASTTGKGKPYAYRYVGTTAGKRKYVYMHREIVGAGQGDDVDHINGDTLDNRKSNLRLCSTSQNNANQRRRENSSSTFRGVSRRGEVWRARIGVNGRSINAGTYESEVDAAIAYDLAAIRFFGEFARTNVIENPVSLC